MKLDRIKPISYFKANAAEIIRDLAEVREPMVITQNGEATAVVQDIASYEAIQETLALLKLLAMGNADIEAGRTVPLDGVRQRFNELRKAR
jgi:prevent-host-death family protein